VVMAIAEGRKGAAKGGILTGDEAQVLRNLLAGHEGAPEPLRGGPARGLARLLRRNPTDAERALWDVMTKSRHFAGLGFKRQVPVGPHICDFVSFPMRVAIELVPADEAAEARSTRRERAAWLAARGYQAIEVATTEVESDLAGLLGRLVTTMQKCQ